MVSELLIALVSAIIGGAFVIGGSALTGYLNLQQSQIEQQEENKRIFAQQMAEQEADAIRELSLRLEQSHRIYGEAVRWAATHTVDEEEYENEVKGTYRDFQEAVEKSTIFLNESAERELRRYTILLRKADRYIHWKIQQSPSEIRRPSSDSAHAIDELIANDDPPEHAELQFSEINRIYHDSKQVLREEISARLDLVSLD